MTTQTHLPSRDAIKAQAKRLRKALKAEGNFITHSETLEMLAHQHGFRDWNGLHAAIGNRPIEPFILGSKVSGHYLGQPISGEIISLTRMNEGARYRISLDLDEAVDVVTFDSFSAFRKRINATVGRTGASAAKTSNGKPQLFIHH